MKNRFTTTTKIRKLNGARLYMLRKQKHITQQQLANLIGVTFQQIQKYEWGVNAMSSNSMHEFAKLFKVPMEHFFEPLNQIGYERNKTSQNIYR